MHYHKWSISDVENMIPWEKDLYVNMLLQELELEREKAKAQKNV
jgi:hypothetical protein